VPWRAGPLPDLFRRNISIGLLIIDTYDITTFSREARYDSGAELAVATGDDGNFPFKFHKIIVMAASRSLSVGRNFAW